MRLNDTVVEIINKNAGKIDAEDFTPVIFEAIEKGVAMELLETFNEAGIIPEHEKVIDALRKYYLDRSTLTEEKKDELERQLKHKANINSIMYMMFKFD